MPSRSVDVADPCMQAMVRAAHSAAMAAMGWRKSVQPQLVAPCGGRARPEHYFRVGSASKKMQVCIIDERSIAREK